MTKTHKAALISLTTSYMLLLTIPILNFPEGDITTILFVIACITGFISMIFQVYLAHQTDEDLCIAVILMVCSLFWLFPFLLFTALGLAMMFIYLMVSLSVHRNAFRQYKEQSG